MTNNTSIPWINDTEIYQNLPIKKAISIIHEAFIDYASKQSLMPEKTYLTLPEFNGDFRCMPAYSKRYNIVGLKWVNSHQDNPKLYQLPAVMAHMIINDAQTAQCLSIIEATSITNLRTGAAGGVAAHALANNTAHSAGFIGCGQQAQFQLEALLHVRNITEVHYFDLNPKNMALFKEKTKPYFNGTYHPHNTIKECCQPSHIITTTTPSKLPLITLDMITPGTHINAIGADAPGKQELDIPLLKNSLIYVDDITQASHSGEINVGINTQKINTNHIKGTLGDVLIKHIEGRQSVHDITVFDSTGLAVQDLALAGYLLRQLSTGHMPSSPHGQTTSS